MSAAGCGFVGDKYRLGLLEVVRGRLKMGSGGCLQICLLGWRRLYVVVCGGMWWYLRS
jgi:hypothetical protein